MGLWGVAIPAMADSITWTNPKGVIQMSNIETLFPDQKKNKKDPVISPPATTVRRKTPARGGKTPSATDADLDRVKTVVENLSGRNQKVTELKQWFFKIMKDPKLFHDPTFVQWMGRITGRELPDAHQKNPR